MYLPIKVFCLINMKVLTMTLSHKSTEPVYGIQQASKAGISCLVRKSEENGIVNLTNNNELQAVIIPSKPNEQAFFNYFTHFKKLNEIKRLSQENKVFEDDSLNLDYLKYFALTIFALGKINPERAKIMNELADFIFKGCDKEIKILNQLEKSDFELQDIAD